MRASWRLELAPAGAGDLLQALLGALEAPYDDVERVGELGPLLTEAGQALEDLVGGLGQLGLLDRLADHRQHGEEAHRRAQHHPLAEGDVDEAGIALVDEGPDALVGDEEQHLVEGGVGLDVAARGQLLHPAPHVAQEGLGRGVALGVGGRLEVAEVVVDGELHVHVQHPTARQQERDVGDGAARQPGLLPVADALDHPRQAQDVVGHPLAPLAAGLGAGQGLAEVLGGLGQGPGGGGGVGQAPHELPVLLGALPVELRRPPRPGARAAR